MLSASASVSARGFSTSTALPRSSACISGSTCSPSLVATITAFTSGREIAARLSPEWNCAPTFCARSRARAGSASETAMKLTAGYSEARRARKAPMRPAPTTAIPSDLRSIILLFRLDPRLLREPPLLLELRLDVLRKRFGRGARPELDAALDEALMQVGPAHGARNCAVQADEDFVRRSGRSDQAVERNVLETRQ